MRDLTGKYCIVTGAGKGIGKAIAKRFLLEQAAGVAILEWDLELAKATAKELDPTGEWQITGFNDLAYNRADGKLYGLFYSKKNNLAVPFLCNIDMFSGGQSVDGDTDRFAVGLAEDRNVQRVSDIR